MAWIIALFFGAGMNILYRKRKTIRATIRHRLKRKSGNSEWFDRRARYARARYLTLAMVIAFTVIAWAGVYAMFYLVSGAFDATAVQGSCSFLFGWTGIEILEWVLIRDTRRRKKN